MNIDAANGIFRLLWNLLLIGSVMATGIKLSFLLLRSLHPRARYLFCLLGFFLAIALPLLATFIWQSPQPAQPHPVASPSEVAHPVQAPDAASSVSVLDRIPARVPVAIWVLGALLLLSREWISHRKLRASQTQWQPASPGIRARLGWPDRIALYTSAQDGPCTAGLIRPRVVLPLALLNDMPIVTIQRIAQHELNHARWRDPLANCVLRAVLALFWPAAPLWILNEMAGAEREAAADRAAVTGEQSGDAAVQYAESLVAVARMLELARDRAAHAVVPLHSGRRLEERIRRIFRIHDSPSLMQLTSGTLFLLIGFGSAPWLPVAMQPREAAIVIRQRIANVHKTFAEQASVEKIVKPGNPLLQDDETKNHSPK